MQNKLLRVPIRCNTKEMLLGTLAKLENVNHILAIVEDDEGVWMMIVDGTPLERINWMLDRIKHMIHEG